MPFDLSGRLVVGLASSALFDLSDSDRVFREQGEAPYRAYQRQHQNAPLQPGVALQFVRRLLALNALRPDDPLIEVLLLSRNDPDTGLRVMNSIEHYGLAMSRAVFLQGKSPYQFIPAFNISLFLSANAGDVLEAVRAGYPAGQIIGVPGADDHEDLSLRVAFDFDGVIADDAAEAVYQAAHSLDAFHAHETANAEVPHAPGPLQGFLAALAQIQQLETERAQNDATYVPLLRVSIVTARGAPAHKRVVNTLRAWNINANDAFFLGGVEKAKVLGILRPHIFFDDQRVHLDPAAALLPCVHIPFGVTNR